MKCLGQAGWEEEARESKERVAELRGRVGGGCHGAESVGGFGLSPMLRLSFGEHIPEQKGGCVCWWPDREKERRGEVDGITKGMVCI